MTDTNLPDSILHLLLAQGPILLACVAGLIVAIRFCRKAPAASVWMAGGFALGIFTLALKVVGYLAESASAVNVIAPVLTALTYLLLLIGAYAGRVNPATTPGDRPQSLWQQVITPLRGYPSLRNVFLNVFSFVFLLVFVLSVVFTILLPESFASTARIKLGLAAPCGNDPRSVQTQVEVVQSEVVLGRVVKDLNLNQEWGKKYAGNQTLKTPESMGILKRRMDVHSVKGTSIIKIRVYSESPKDAADLANAVAAAYLAHLREESKKADAEPHLEAEIVDHAEPAMRPVRPNRPANFALGALTGLWLAFIVAVGMSWVAFRFGKRATPAMA